MRSASNESGDSLVWSNLLEASNFVVSYLNAGPRNITSMQGTKLYAQKYVLALETVSMGIKC